LDVLVALLILAALLIGLAIGWYVGGRGAGEAAAMLRATLQGMTTERDIALREREAIREARDAVLLDLRSQEAKQTERERAFEERLTELMAAKEALSAQFSEVGAKLLGEAQAAFLQRADERFNQAGEKSEAQLKALLQPVETTLKRYEEGLQKVEKDRVGSYSELKLAVEQLTQGNEVVRRETARLTNVMRSSPKHRGRWGEEQLRTILEAAGLAENVDFTLQSSVSDGERQLRPDCVINLPGERCIIVDVKCPLVHFEAAFDEEDEERRAHLLLQHSNAMKAYAADLGRKGYWRQFDLSPDFVIMFIPGEHFLAAAAERAPELIETAFRNGVVIASTINMLALAKVMANMRREEALAEVAREIGAAGKELYRRLAAMTEHIQKLGRNLGQATVSYNAMIGSLESQVLVQARRFEDLKVDTGGKTIDPLVPVETNIRPLLKLGSVAEGEAAE
jgi:DNA recombination protein RmuC